MGAGLALTGAGSAPRAFKACVFVAYLGSVFWAVGAGQAGRLTVLELTGEQVTARVVSHHVIVDRRGPSWFEHCHATERPDGRRLPGWLCHLDDDLQVGAAVAVVADATGVVAPATLHEADGRRIWQAFALVGLLATVIPAWLLGRLAMRSYLGPSSSVIPTTSEGGIR